MSLPAERAAGGERLAEHRVRADERREIAEGFVAHVAGQDPVARERCDARLERFGQADPELEAERLGDLFVEVGADRPAVDATHDFTDEVPVRDGVVAVLGAGLPRGRLTGERVDHGVPVERLLEGEWLVDPGESGLVREQVADRDRFLVRLRELGPVLGDGCVEVELAVLHELVRADRGRALRGGEHHDHRVGLPRPTGLLVGDATPDVHHGDAAVVGRERGAHFETVGEVLLERLENVLEAGRGPTVDRHEEFPTTV